VERFEAIIDKDSPFFGCTLSHRKIIEIAQKENLDYVCVLEDDAYFKENILIEISKIIKNLPIDWHILYL
jgi:GR25 family glycosyltransferase involved in LPS biosynthesis